MTTKRVPLERLNELIAYIGSFGHDLPLGEIYQGDVLECLHELSTLRDDHCAAWAQLGALGVELDPNMTLADHVSSLRRAYQELEEKLQNLDQDALEAKEKAEWEDDGR